MEFYNFLVENVFIACCLRLDSAIIIIFSFPVYISRLRPLLGKSKQYLVIANFL